MQKNVYVVKCTHNVHQTMLYCTLTFTATEAAAVQYLYNYVEDATYLLESGAKTTASTSSMAAYLQNVREYMEEVGGCAIWDISCNGEQLEQFVNGHMYADEWDCAKENGGLYLNANVVV